MSRLLNRVDREGGDISGSKAVGILGRLVPYFEEFPQGIDQGVDEVEDGICSFLGVFLEQMEQISSLYNDLYFLQPCLILPHFQKNLVSSILQIKMLSNYLRNFPT